MSKFDRYAKSIAKQIAKESRDDWMHSEIKKHRIKSSSGLHNRQVGTSSNPLDITREAKPPGKRRSKYGKIYYEHRKNRSDIPGTRI